MERKRKNSAVDEKEASPRIEQEKEEEEEEEVVVVEEEEEEEERVENFHVPPPLSAEEIEEHNRIDREIFDTMPPGYRFVPTREELINYLRKKVTNSPLPYNRIRDVDIYKHHPQELTSMYKLHRGKEWYFFTQRSRKYPNGQRTDRAAGDGYWKATGAVIPVRDNQGVKIGTKRSLVYYEGKAKEKNEKKTDWIMHEYRVESDPKTEVENVNTVGQVIKKEAKGMKDKRDASNKATTAPYPIPSDKGVKIGSKSTLVYYEGKAKEKNEKKTDWFMPEYRFEDENTNNVGPVANKDPKTEVKNAKTVGQVVKKDANDMKDKKDEKTIKAKEDAKDKLDDWVLCMIYNNASKKEEVNENQHEENDAESVPANEEQLPNQNQTGVVSDNAVNFNEQDVALENSAMSRIEQFLRNPRSSNERRDDIVEHNFLDNFNVNEQVPNPNTNQIQDEALSSNERRDDIKELDLFK